MPSRNGSSGRGSGVVVEERPWVGGAMGRRDGDARAAPAQSPSGVEGTIMNMKVIFNIHMGPKAQLGMG